MLTLIGSSALSHHINGIASKDVDLVGTYDEIVEFARAMNASSFIPINEGKYIKFTIGKKIFEAEVAYPDSSAEQLINVVKNEDWWTCTGEFHKDFPIVVPSLDFLYTLKMSHRYLRNSPHFHKTRKDILTMRQYDANIPDYLEQFYEDRQKATYHYSHPKLNVLSKDFFADDGIKYVYSHDDIHEIVKINTKPAYTYFKPEDSEVMVSRKMWDELPHHFKMCAVIEEAMVLAIERSLVPFPGVLTPDQAYEKALIKISTSITSGWFREFCWENFDSARNIALLDYWDNFQYALSKNRIKPLTTDFVPV